MRLPGAASRLSSRGAGRLRLFVLSPTGVDWRRFSSCCLGAGACLPLRRRGRAMPFSSSEFPPAPYRPMAAGRGAVRRSPFDSSLPISRSRWLSLLPRAAHSIRGGRDGRLDGGCLLGYRHVAYRVSSIDVYNEYDICDVYKRYKDTMIREYDGYMG